MSPTSGKTTRRECRVDCPDGFYKNIQECRECDFSCRTCNSGDSSSCTDCNDGYGLIDGNCVYLCPKTHYLSVEDNICKKKNILLEELNFKFITFGKDNLCLSDSSLTMM